MNIDIQTKSGLPIYEQIERQIKDMIITGIIYSEINQHLNSEKSYTDSSIILTAQLYISGNKIQRYIQKGNTGHEMIFCRMNEPFQSIRYIAHFV